MSGSAARLSLAVCALFALPAQAAAGPVLRTGYDAAITGAWAGTDFEDFPTLPEPGMVVEGLITGPGFTLGEHLAGQRLEAIASEGGPHDTLEGRPSPPVTALSSPVPGRNLAVSYHAGFGSNALYPLGEDGFPAVSALGEGSVALVLDQDTDGVALRLHADYADPLAARPAPGQAWVDFYRRDGTHLDRHIIRLAPGVMSLGFRHDPGEIAAVTVVNGDPGGLALDDLRFAVTGMGS